MTMFDNGPLKNWSKKISSGFGVPHPINKPGHHGIDFRDKFGAAIRACHGGKVRFAGFQDSGYGWVVVVENSELETTYAHCRELYVKVGDIIFPGQTIATVGSSGFSTGPHLHFGLRIKPWSRRDGWNGYSDPTYALLSVSNRETFTDGL